MLSSSIISILSLPDGEDAAVTVGCATKKGKDQKWTQVKWFYWLCSARAWACVDVTGVMRVKTAWDSSWRITERWTQADCVPLERRSNLDIYRKPSLCLFFLPSGICFITAYFVSRHMPPGGLASISGATKACSQWLRGPLVAIWAVVSAKSAPPSIFAFLPPLLHVFLPSSPPLSSTILSLFLACFSAAGERHDVLWQIPWTVISFKLAQTSVHL